MPESVLLAGGGTAGHVNPLLAVADELRARDAATRITVLGTAEGLEADLVPARGHRLVHVPRVPLPRRPSAELFSVPSRLRAAIKVAEDAIAETGARVVVGFGGYVSTPAYVAARRRGVPVVVHEQNARPGLANRLGARRAAAVAVTFPGTPLRGARLTGLPLRHEIADLALARRSDAAAARRDAAAALGLDPARTILVVTGGSLGAQSLNAAVAGAAAEIAALGPGRPQVLHLTGRGKDADVRAAVRAAGLGDDYVVAEYLLEMERALAVADLVLCRAGAGTVAELTALGIPAAYVPLPIGNGEQRLNAQPAVDAGGGLLVEDRLLSPAWVGSTLLPLLGDRGRREEMAAAAMRVGRPEATAAVVDLVLAAAGGAR
ncbi:undecaprenyldiphospho-muramoylpentapeptide beta-N-acetylglucosaminyltransferase [Sanguibacter sp. HDW7]|uniref:undecaprenyldiphospho-muramoylpentapeptide beta-N-acetylglucosaminyltransferase n=1 Tax=Sanguibacter sp. HDW7 TaxID=2714931 RepID=UPI00140C6E0A|nr:undecaprenyldiphospho-muramoylpentapeptide beta-N-acetylglucosaminyltransferase [Sanguibacter sp. HDW7]QIK83311.1 undecaprenyldiphospho-muramoylpentapeptide beta-N-acetylglucosaminyltransferase [Sanguibacter sp. HDW7]